nr:MAG TPA: chitin synthase regulator [Caudoviricetes sp.]
MTIEQYLFFKVIVFIMALIFALIWWIKERR